MNHCLLARKEVEYVDNVIDFQRYIGNDGRDMTDSPLNLRIDWNRIYLPVPVPTSPTYPALAFFHA